MTCFDTGELRVQHLPMDDMDGESTLKILPDANEVRGGMIPGTSLPAFSLCMQTDSPIPVLIAAPHAGRSYPDALLRAMREPDYTTVRLEDRYIDQVAVQVARQTGAGLLVSHASRAMVDLNRADDDVDWEMVEEGAPEGLRRPLTNRRSRTGLGLVPRRLPHLGEIWKGPIHQAELQARIDGIHRPYHRALSTALEALRDQWGAALLVDLHSMPPLKPQHSGERAAEVVLGDRFGASCDGFLVANAFSYLAKAERPAAHNRPYAGGYVLDRHAAPARGIHAIQLELCRSTYLDHSMTEPSARLPAIARIIAGLVRELGECTAALGRQGKMPLAAE